MKITDIIQSLLTSPNVASQQPIYEKYDKNVQGSTIWERGDVAASMCAPFRDYEELPTELSQTGVAIATGGNPNLAKIEAKAAAINAVSEAYVLLSCVGATPLAITDCLNFGNPEKKEQMGQFVQGIEGVKEACNALKIPIVSGNVSLYNESQGKSIPPSALISAFGRVDHPKQVPVLSFAAPDQTIFLIGARSSNLGGSEMMRIAGKTDTQIPKNDLKQIETISQTLSTLAQKKILETCHPILRGGMVITLIKSCFLKSIGAQIEIPADDIPGFLFSEDLGAIVATSKPEELESIAGSQALKIGTTTKDFSIKITSTKETILKNDLSEWKDQWENELRKVF